MNRALWVMTMGYGSLGTNRHTLSASKAASKVISNDLYACALLILLENGDRTCHGAKAIFFTNIGVDCDFKHVEHSLEISGMPKKRIL
jgi:hypothetical protein